MQFLGPLLKGSQLPVMLLRLPVGVASGNSAHNHSTHVTRLAFLNACQELQGGKAYIHTNDTRMPHVCWLQGLGLVTGTM